MGLAVQALFIKRVKKKAIGLIRPTGPGGLISGRITARTTLLRDVFTELSVFFGNEPGEVLLGLPPGWTGKGAAPPGLSL